MEFGVFGEDFNQKTLCFHQILTHPAWLERIHFRPWEDLQTGTSVRCCCCCLLRPKFDRFFAPPQKPLELMQSTCVGPRRRNQVILSKRRRFRNLAPSFPCVSYVASFPLANSQALGPKNDLQGVKNPIFFSDPKRFGGV